MFQLAMPAIKIAAPYIVKGSIAGARVLLASIAVGYGTDRIFQAGADHREEVLVDQGAIPVPAPKTTRQKIKSEMLFFAKSALETIGTTGLSCLILGIGIAVSPVNPTLGGALAIAAMGVLVINVVAWMYRKDIARGFRAAGRAIKRTAISIWGRVKNAVKVLFVRPEKWTEVVEEAEMAQATATVEPEILPADGPDPEGTNVTDATNEVFNTEADRDDETYLLTFEARLTTLVGLLNEDDFRTNMPQAINDFVDELPQSAFELNAGYKAFVAWITKSSLSANQKTTAKKQFRSQIVQRVARRAA